MSQFLQTEGISINDGEGGKIGLAIQVGVIRNLTSSLSTFLQARAPQGASVIGNGTVNYELALFGETKAYAQGQTGAVNPTITNKGVAVGSYRTSVTEIEDFDQSMVGPAGQEAIANVIANISTQIIADQNANFIIALNDYFNKHYSQTLYLPELVSKKVLSEDEGRLLQKEVANAVNDMTKVVNKKYILPSAREFFGIIDRFGATNLSLVLTRLNASNSAFDLMIKGTDGDNLEHFRFGGVEFLIENLFNNSIAQGASFNGDYAYDSLHNLGCVISREFIAFPTGIKYVKQVTNPENGNARFIAKYCFAKPTGANCVLRPELGLGFVNEVKVVDSADAEVSTLSIAVGDNVTLYHNLGEARNVTVASSDESKVTVSLVGKTIIVNGGATGNATITVKLDGNAVYSFAVTVA